MCNLAAASSALYEGPVTREELEAVYRRDGTRLWRAVLVYAGGDRRVADDAVAEAFARALANLVSIREPVGWLYRVAFRLAAADMRRREQPASDVEDAAVSDELPDSWLVSVLATVPARQRAVLYLHYQSDLPVKQIAAALGISSGLVKVELHRGRRAVRRIIELDERGASWTGA